jgi:phage-related protein
MATANKMGSLFQGSGLEQVRAMELSTKAMQRAADVASVMGIDATWAMESIAGAAKGNFTMMDNLGVSMNATTLEAYALEKGMNFKWNTASNAEKAELAMKMFFERTEQYAGNFAKEADGTLAGSFDRMKTNVQDILANMALGRAIDVPLANMRESVLAFAHNIVPTVVNILNQLPTVVSEVVNAVKPVIQQALSDIKSPFGEILVAALKLVQTIWDLRGPILAVGALFLAWRGITDVIFVITKAMKAYEIVMRVVEGVQAAHNAALWGTTVAVEAQGAASIAAGVGMKLYAIGTGIATAATTVFSTAVGVLNTLFIATPIGWIVLGIAALIAIIVLCVKHWDEITAAVKRFGEWLVDLGTKIAAFAVEAWGKIKEFFTGIGTAIAAFAVEAWGKIKEFFIGLGAAIANFASEAWTKITGFFSTVYNGVMTFLFGENAPLVEQFIASIFEKIASFFGGIWEKVTTFFSEIGSAIAAFFVETWGKITAAFTSAIDGIASFFGSVWEKVTTFFSEIGSAIAAFFVETWGKITAAFTSAIDGIASFFGSIWEKITSFISGIGGALSSFAESVRAKIQPLFDWFGQLFGGIKAMWQNVVSVFKAEGIIGVFKKIAGGIFSWVLTPIEKILRALDWIPGGVGNQMKGWADKIANVKNGFSGFSTIESAPQSNPVSKQPPTRTVADASRYSESVSTSRVELTLPDGVNASRTGAVAPGVTVNRKAG